MPIDAAPGPASRVAAGIAALVVAAGAIVFGQAVLATQGLVYSGFVSETGEPGAPHDTGYRLGIFGFAIGLILLGAAFGRLLPATAGLLLAGGASAATSSLVSCSAGCPLPPYETPTLGDLVHASASVFGLLACAAAMGTIALRAADSPLRTVSRAWLMIVLPLLLVAGVSLVGIGRGAVTGSAEKILIAVTIGWVIVASVLVVRRTPVVTT